MNYKYFKVVFLSFFLAYISMFSQEFTQNELYNKAAAYNSVINKTVLNDTTEKDLIAIFEIAKEKKYYNVLEMASPVLAQRMLSTNRLDEALYYAKHLIVASKESKSKYSQALAYTQYFRIFSLKGNYPDAIKNALIAESYFEQAEDHTINGEIILLLDFHNLLTEINDFNRAEEKIIKVNNRLKIYQGKDSVLLKGIAADARGRALRKEENYLEARNYFIKALACAKTFGFENGIITSKAQLGIIDYELGNYKESITLLSEAYKELTQSKVQYSLAETAYYLGKNYVTVKAYKQAIDYFNNAMVSAKAHQDSEYFCKSALSKLKILFDQGKEEEAEQTLNTTIESELFLNYDEKDEMFLLLLNQYAGNNQRYKEIVRQYQEAFRGFKNKLHKENLKKLEYVYDYQKTKDSLTLNKQKIYSVIQTSKKKQERIYWVVSLILISLITIIIIYYNRVRLYKVKNQKSLIKAKLYEERKIHNEKLIAHRNRKLIDFAIHVNEKNETLNYIKQQLKKVINDAVGEKKELHNLVGFISNTINQNEEQVAMFKDADKLNEQFLVNLSTKYPELNKQERRVITFIRLGLSSKQIALQMNISHTTVENYRYQIRKKMDLSRGISLKSFVNTI